MTDTPDARITVAEVGRRLDRLEHSTAAAFQDLKRQLDTLHFVSTETFNMQNHLEDVLRNRLEDRIALLEIAQDERHKEGINNRRIALTGLVFPVLTAVFAAIIIAAIYGGLS